MTLIRHLILVCCFLSRISAYGQEHYVTTSDTVFEVNDVFRLQHDFRFPICTRLMFADSMEWNHEAVQEILAIMEAHPEMSFQLEVHTDSRGSEAGNQRVSEVRSLTIRNALLRKGCDSSRIEFAGMGENRPMVVYQVEDSLLPQKPDSYDAEAIVLTNDFIMSFMKSDPLLAEYLHQLNRRTELRITAIRKEE